MLFRSKAADAIAVASARTKEDGTFVTQVSEPGRYGVTFFWPSMVTVDGAIEEGPDRFNNRLRDPRHPMAEIDIHEGENQLEPLEVK
ncbi:hypothetical protein M4951_25050 [Blastopirellula sp. J2-11]|uniref:hypothetical protein n=1 Tax=Blastopirellula sp. J2-11 TaxID=2943192 RepID=UPI0021C953FC|nr:hypothetical protein [Blastopirellula sp. J2-11]UUO06598.1 hypothetical protein M4951_25050 [Blastopirellula sp. J2-11]